MSTVLLRPARPTDAGATGAILTAFNEDTPWMPKLHSGAETISFTGHLIERGWVDVAEAEGQVTGFLAREGEAIHALYIAPDAQGQGIGTALLQRAQAASPRLSLWTFQANTGAQRFYKRHGFAEVLRTSGTGNDEKLPDIRMFWQREAP